MKGCGG